MTSRQHRAMTGPMWIRVDFGWAHHAAIDVNQAICMYQGGRMYQAAR